MRLTHMRYTHIIHLNSRTLKRHKELSGWLFKNTDCPAEMREQSLTKQEVPKWCTNAVRPQPKGNAAVMMLP